MPHLNANNFFVMTFFPNFFNGFEISIEFCVFSKLVEKNVLWVILALFANINAEHAQKRLKNENSFSNVKQNELYFPFLIFAPTSCVPTNYSSGTVIKWHHKSSHNHQTYSIKLCI